ncbi:MAG: twin-arginine translocation protein TatA/E family subunit [Marmoricola sp.]|nr:twin-arginine translocation protein TatA/E family subunit [Marmoricola sp.]
MTHALVLPLLAGLGTTELLIIVGIIVLLFGASKLPDLARGSGRALRIFKAETKGLLTDDEDDKLTPEQREINARNRAAERRAEELREAEQRVADLRAGRDGTPGTSGNQGTRGTDEPGSPLR